MALILVITLLVFGIWIVGWLFTSLLPITQRLWNVIDYNAAYYGAVMSAERWLLALKYHWAWFEWESWLKTWNQADKTIISNFWRLGAANSDAYWKITSRTTSIPKKWEWNVERLYRGSGSLDYNVLWYNESIYLPLSIDKTSSPSDYYKDPNDSFIEDIYPGIGGIIEWRFRLPPKVQEWFKNKSHETILHTDTIEPNADIDDDRVADDIIIQWWMEGLLADEYYFTIQPTIESNFIDGEPQYTFDNSFRESAINAWSDQDIIWYIPRNNIKIGDDTYSIVKNEYNQGWVPWSSLTWLNILPLWFPLNMDDPKPTFEKIIDHVTQNNISDLMLSFTLTNLMKNKEWDIFPFLEWRLDAWNVIIPDRFFSIDAVWKVNNYTVHFLIKKPVQENSNVSNFTIIF